MTEQNIIHKAMPSKLNFLSHTAFSFWQNEGENYLSIYDRLGSLLMLTVRENEIYQKAAKWQDSLLDWFSTEINSLTAQKEAFLKNAGIEETPEVITPQHYHADILITYPSSWRLIEKIKLLDRQVSDIENMWLAGIVDDNSRHNISSRAINLLRKLRAKIEHVTAPGNSNRRNGHFKTTQLIALIRGGMELYIDDADIARERKKIADLNNAENTKDTKPENSNPKAKNKQNALKESGNRSKTETTTEQNSSDSKNEKQSAA